MKQPIDKFHKMYQKYEYCIVCCNLGFQQGLKFKEADE